MKKTSKLTLLLICISAIIAGCKKQSQDLTIKKPVNGKGIHATLTNEEYSKMMEYLTSTEKIDSADWVNKINALKYETIQKGKSASQIKTLALGDANTVGSDELNAFDFNTLGSLEIYQGDVDYSTIVTTGSNVSITEKKGFRIFNEELSTFAIRGNTIRSVVPFVAVIRLPNTPGSQGSLLGISQMAQNLPILEPHGSGWGTYEPSGVSWIQETVRQGNTSIANVAILGKETRSRIVSISGDVKFTGEVNAGVYKAGAELSTGWVIQSSNIVYNSYTLSGALRITYNGGGINDAGLPTFTYVSNLKITQTGILKS
jgi:hypothetical protein